MVPNSIDTFYIPSVHGHYSSMVSRQKCFIKQLIQYINMILIIIMVRIVINIIKMLQLISFHLYSVSVVAPLKFETVFSTIESNLKHAVI